MIEPSRLFDSLRHVAYICADPGIPVFGCKGASVHVQEIVRSLLRAGHRVTLLANRFDGEAPADLGALRVVALPALPKATAEACARAALSGNPALREALNRNGPFDLVYERYSLWSDAGMQWAREAGVPGVLEVNAPLIDEQRVCRELVLPHEAERVAQSVFAAASALIAVSPGVARYLAGFDPQRSRIHVVSNGVDPKRFSTLGRPREGRGSPVVGFLGTLKPWHGVATLVDAFALLRATGVSARLSLVGDGPQRDEIRARLDCLGLSSHAHFTGAVAPDQVPQALAEMDIGVAPYPARDDFYFSPLKIVEYMAAGLPVVTTRVGQLEELVRHDVDGLLVAPGEPTALAAALAELLADPARRQRMGDAGRARVLRERSWDSIVCRLLQIAAASGTAHGRSEARTSHDACTEVSTE